MDAVHKNNHRNRWNNVDNIDEMIENVEHEDVLQQVRLREQLCQYFISPAESVPW